MLFSCQITSNSFATPWTVAHQFLCPWDFPGKNTGVGKNTAVIAISFSRGSSWSRGQTCVSCIGRWILYHLATREAHYYIIYLKLIWLCQLNIILQKKKKKLILRLPLNVDFRGHFQQAIWLASSKKSIFLQNFILKIHSNSHSETSKLCLLQLIQI